MENYYSSIRNLKLTWKLDILITSSYPLKHTLDCFIMTFFSLQDTTVVLNVAQESTMRQEVVQTMENVYVGGDGLDLTQYIDPIKELWLVELNFLKKFIESHFIISRLFCFVCLCTLFNVYVHSL